MKELIIDILNWIIRTLEGEERDVYVDLYYPEIVSGEDIIKTFLIVEGRLHVQKRAHKD